MPRKNYIHSVPIPPREEEHAIAEERRRLHMVDTLSHFLASTYVLYQKALFYHWNVTGEHFLGLHRLFGRQYMELHKAGDTLAERIRTLGGQSPGNMSEFAALSRIAEDRKLPASAQGMVANLLQSHEILLREARDIESAARKTEDAITSALMTERMASHSKAAWMLRSLLAGNHYG
jgi:starvation-inducible DNA-binding protein